jgi:hypothetical protein
MRRHTLLSIIALSLAAGGAGGYLLRAQKMDGSMVLSLKDAVQEDYLASQDSFSRVRNTRNTLDALSTRYGIEIMDALWAYAQLPKDSDSDREKAGQFLDRILLAAEASMQEFEGTAQQLAVTQSYLFALQRAERFDRWTEVYLKAVHEHPTHPFVARMANDAVKISKLAGQQDRVIGALRHLLDFEPASADRPEIAAALNAAVPCFSQLQFSRAAASVGELEKCDPLD